MQEKIITISGTSGTGKSFLSDKLLQTFPGITEIAGITTRPMREGEIQGKSSHFITMEEFKKMEEERKLTLIKEFFGNKYAWFKSDLMNDEKFKIMNISYKSIQELREKGLDLFAIFVRPSSEKQLRTMLQARNSSQAEYEKRMRDYYESEEFLAKSNDLFDLIFTNGYDERSTNEFLSCFADQFILSKQVEGQDIEERIDQLLQANAKADYNISVAESIIREQQRRRMRDGE